MSMYTDGSGNLVIESTSKDTKTKVLIGPLAVDEANSRVGAGTQSPSSDFGINGEADFAIRQEREATAATAGRNLTLQAGGAKSGGTNLDGGTLKLAGGISTGSGESSIEFQVAGPGSSGTDDNAPASVLSLDSAGLVFAAGEGRSIEMDQAASGNGDNLSIQAGQAAAGATNGNGGNLLLASGVSTGSGGSAVQVKAPTPGSSGTDDADLATVAEFKGGGDVILGLQAQLAQAATVGFVMIPTVATGTPSGTPAAVPAGMCAITFVPATGKLAVWDGSAWKTFTPD